MLARLAPYDGVGMAIEPADVSPGMLMTWFEGIKPAFRLRGKGPAEPMRDSAPQTRQVCGQDKAARGLLDTWDYLSDEGDWLVGPAGLFSSWDSCRCSRACDPEGAAYVRRWKSLYVVVLNRRWLPPRPT